MAKTPPKMSYLARAKRAAEMRDRAEEAYRAAIVEAAEHGFSYAIIAEHLGISKPRVGQIVLARKRDAA